MTDAFTKVPKAQNRNLQGLPRPTRAPDPDECPNFTHYLPWGGEMVVVLCGLTPGHPGKHHAVFVNEDGTEIEFDWETPVTIEFQYEGTPPVTPEGHSHDA